MTHLHMTYTSFILMSHESWDMSHESWDMTHSHMRPASTHDLFSLHTKYDSFIHETWGIHTWLIPTPHMTYSRSTHDIISLPADLHMTDSLRMTYSIHMTYSLHKTYSIHTTYFHLRQIYIWHPYMTYSPFRWIENHSVTHMRHDSFT